MTGCFAIAHAPGVAPPSPLFLVEQSQHILHRVVEPHTHAFRSPLASFAPITRLHSRQWCFGVVGRCCRIGPSYRGDATWDVARVRARKHAAPGL